MIKAAIIGGSGYTGAELIRLLQQHPQVSLQFITSRSNAGQRVDSIIESLRGYTDLCFVAPDEAALSDCDVVFFATPHGVAMHQMPTLFSSKAKIIDLSADFRLQDAQLWQDYYQEAHACPELLKEAVYGLPELNRQHIATANLIANPGCYPTAIALGFMPLLAKGLADPETLVADAKSGVSGAGRQAKQPLLYNEVAETFKAYGLPKHRHLPEIQQTLTQIAGKNTELVFAPHLVPMARGIHATLHGRLLDANANLQAVFEDYFQNEPFVDVMPEGSFPATHTTKGGNLCRIAVHKPAKDRFIVLSVIDNLIKGAAGQAVQNMNILFGFDEACGLKEIPVWP